MKKVLFLLILSMFIFGCENSDDGIIYPPYVPNDNIAPTAFFKCIHDNLTLTCVDQSTDVDGSIVSYLWNFGNGKTSTEKDISVTYEREGSYIVSLRVTDNLDAFSTYSGTAHMKKDVSPTAPIAKFEYIIDNLTVTFKNMSTDSNGAIKSYAWVFGDDTTSNEKDPTVTYKAAGSYNVELTVTDDSNETGTIKMLIYVGNTTLTLDVGTTFFTPSKANSTYALLANVPSTSSRRTLEYKVSTTAGIAAKSLFSTSNDEVIEDDNKSIIVDPYKRFRDKEKELLSPENLEKSSKALTKVSASSLPANITLGTKWSGINAVASLSTDTYKLYDGICGAVSEHAIFFVDSAITINDELKAKLNDYGKKFDAIYPIILDKFGEPGDVDNNPKIIIFFYNIAEDNILGYFDPEDKFPTSVQPKSNLADIFYLNYKLINDTYDMSATLAHEFQHMVYFDSRRAQGKRTTDSWLNEGMAMLSEYYTGFYDYKVDSWTYSFFTDGVAGDSLIDFDTGNYGFVSIYTRYLAEQFGDDVIKRIYRAANDEVGIATVEEATGEKFNEIFKDFTLAAYLSGTGVADSKYNFKSIDVQYFRSYGNLSGLSPNNTLLAGKGGLIKIAPYSFYLVKWTNPVSSITVEGKDFFGFANY